MGREHLFGLVIVMFVVFPQGIGADDLEKKPLDMASLMRKKLAASQKLLGGLALNDFVLIKNNAEALNDLSQQAAFKAIKTPRYEAYSDEFQRITRKMAQQAKEKNIDGAALSYVEMTLICVKCHEHVREQKVGQSRPLHLPDGIGQRSAAERAN